MKKHTFYSIVKFDKIKAIKWTGWTDGTFNYYKDKFGKWYTIEPTTGLSTGYPHNTRQQASEHVHTPEMMEKIKTAIKTDLQERFNKLVQEAQAEELQKCS